MFTPAGLYKYTNDVSLEFTSQTDKFCARYLISFCVKVDSVKIVLKSTIVFCKCKNCFNIKKNFKNFVIYELIINNPQYDVIADAKNRQIVLKIKSRGKITISGFFL